MPKYSDEVLEPALLALFFFDDPANGLNRPGCRKHPRTFLALTFPLV